MRADLAAYELRTGLALRAVAHELAALPPSASDVEVLAVLGATANAAPAITAIEPRSLPTLGQSIEAWGLAAGLREVAFVTVAPERVDATIAEFPGAHVERRARHVEIGPQDRWQDDRRRGAPRVELFFARDAATARHAAALQAADPTRHAAELGALFGYPACCVAAFVAQRTRNDNSLNRYLTAARTIAPGPWPWELNELHLRLVAFYPCAYDCPAAQAVARATVAAIGNAHPAIPPQLATALTATVIYVDHDHQVWLRCRAEPDRYDAIAAIGGGRALPALVAAAARADRLVTADHGIELHAGAHAVVEVVPLPLVARFG